MSEHSEAEQEAVDARLMDGINSQNPSLVSDALMSGANPNSPERLPFCFAAGYGNLPILRMLADAGGDPSLGDDSGSTPLIYAIANGETAACDYLLQRFPDQPLSNERTSALQHCITPEYQQELMLRLLDAGANPHDACPHDTRYFTCFDLVSDRQLGEAMHLMNQYDREKLPPLHMVTHDNTAQPAQALLQHPQGWQSFAKICDKLEEQGTPLTKADLLQGFGEGNSRCYLQRAAECYRLTDAISYLNGRGEQVTTADLLQEDGQPNALLSTCIERQSINALMSLDNWSGHPKEELRELHNALPDSAREQVENLHSLTEHLRNQQAPKQTGMGR